MGADHWPDHLHLCFPLPPLEWPKLIIDIDLNITAEEDNISISTNSENTVIIGTSKKEEEKKKKLKKASNDVKKDGVTRVKVPRIECEIKEQMDPVQSRR